MPSHNLFSLQNMRHTTSFLFRTHDIMGRMRKKHCVPNSYKQGHTRAPMMTCDRSTHNPTPKHRNRGVHALLSHIITGVHRCTCTCASMYNVYPCWQMTWRYGYARACLNNNLCALPLRHVRPYECTLLMTSLLLLRLSTLCTFPLNNKYLQTLHHDTILMVFILCFKIYPKFLNSQNINTTTCILNVN